MRAPKNVKLVLIITSIIWGLLIIPSVIFAPFGAFLYDDPTGTTVTNFFRDIFAAFWLTGPVSIFVALVGPWILYSLKKKTAAFYVALLPLAHLIATILAGILLFSRGD